VSDAHIHSLTFVPTRRQTNGVPLEPAMTTEKRVDVAPLLRLRGAQSARFRFDTAGFTQGDNAVPAVVGNGLCDLFVVVAAIGQPQHLTPIVRANLVLQVERAQRGHDMLMFTVIGQTMRLAIRLAIERNRPQRHQQVPQEQDDIGPLMTDDIPLAVIERLGVFRMQTGPVLQRRVDDDHDFPGQAVDPFERFGTLPSLCFGETFERRDSHLGMRLQHFRKKGWMQSGKPGSLLEGMLRGDDHEQEQIAGANPLKPLTDGDLTFDPSLQGASEHHVSPQCAHSDMGGGDDSIGQHEGCPEPLVKDVIYGRPRTASL
jgi:hypothetical protein